MSQTSPSQQYVDKHKLTDIFHELMKEVLETKPEKPVEFLIDQLTKYQKDGFKKVERNVIFILVIPSLF